MPAHVVTSSLGPSKASALPMLHALTGSDTVSFFRNRGKKSAWDVWNVFPELTPVLFALKASPEIIMEESLAVLTEVCGTPLLPNKQSIESQRSTPGAILKEIKGI